MEIMDRASTLHKGQKPGVLFKLVYPRVGCAGELFFSLLSNMMDNLKSPFSSVYAFW